VSAKIRGLVSVLAVATVAGCSSVPDDLDPSTWASGASDWVSSVFSSSPSDNTAPQPDHETGQTPVTPAPAEKPQLGNDERPKAEPTAERQQIAEGLIADRTNAQYAEAEAKREGDATRPLDEPASAPADQTSTAQPSTATPPATTASAPASAPAPSPASSTPASAPPSAPAPTKPLTSSSAAPAQTPPPVPSAATSTDTDAIVAPSARVNATEGQSQAAAPAPQAPVAPQPKPQPVQVAAAAPPPAPTPAPKPAAPPQTQQVAAATPAPAPAPAPRPSVAAGNGDLVAATYRQRLAEFNAVSAADGASRSASSAAASAPSASEGSVMSDAGVLPNSKVTAAHGSGGAHPLSALDQSKAAANFEVAEVAFDEGTAVLMPTEEAALRQVVEVYRSNKGAAKIGIIGHSNSPRLDVSAVANRESNRSLAAERADAVARALEKMGIPAARIYAGATGETAGDYVEVFATY
jgi:outer membrane protein OmpA-like peptidoglycan-associated protein